MRFSISHARTHAHTLTHAHSCYAVRAYVYMCLSVYLSVCLLHGFVWLVFVFGVNLLFTDGLYLSPQYQLALLIIMPPDFFYWYICFIVVCLA